MKNLKLLLTAFAMIMLSGVQVQAQGLKDLFNKENLEDMATSVLGDKLGDIIEYDLTGTWKYVAPAVEFETEDLLKQAGGSVAAKLIEEKMSTHLQKFGITPEKMSYTFNADSTFMYTSGRIPLRGEYSFDQKTKQLEMRFIRIFDIPAEVKIVGDRMDLLFKADKMLLFLSKIATKSKSTALQSISKLADSYDGMRMGFTLQRTSECSKDMDTPKIPVSGKSHGKFKFK